MIGKQMLWRLVQITALRSCRTAFRFRGTVRGVTIKVTKDDPMTRRMQEAMERMKHSFAWEIERIPDETRSWRVLALPCAEILLPHRDHDARKWKLTRLVFQNGTTWVYRVEYQLEDSHKTFWLCAP
jgi:hypothetical protein